ncbi:putative elongator complex protein 1 [Vermiconidia calcicola]|uniref:Elongator complex protein 1 n=1 Tax=Vermiconidia calcicola TaxID=1690605 RepID=A0ACC3NC29_9PEZI|nr:putative elongator complex protein 1 [Vermiconidia calcicola]
MRNLRNTKHAKYNLGGASNANITATAWDIGDNSLVLAFGPSETSPAISLKRLASDAKDANDAIAITSWDAPSPNPDLEVDRIVDLHCLPDSKTISIVLAGGDIVVVREEPQPEEDLIEIVGSVDAGISAASWSPDEELLAICTGADTLLFMTRDFEGIANIALSSEDLKVSNHVSVGWGKKETQFKGRGAAKALRDPTVPEHVDEGTLSKCDDATTTISWRGDGQYVAMNSTLDVEPKRRVIRVYSRDGTLESVSEPVNGLEGVLSWKPSGQIIAGIQRHEDKIDVVFFERNGLRHGEFSLRLSEEDILTVGSSIDLRWNIDSTVLAISMKDRVQLWTMGNYHYYLKQEIRLSPTDKGTATTVWHPERPLQLYCFNPEDLRGLSYSFEINRGAVTPPYDIGIVAVIDGKKLKITPLRTANIPPPMAFDEIELPDNALDVAVSDDGTEIACLHHGLISMWKCYYTSKPAVKAYCQSKRALPDIRRDGIQVDENTFTVLPISSLFIRTDHDRIFYRDGSAHSPEYSHEIERCRVDTSDPTMVVWRDASGHQISFSLTGTGTLLLQSSQQTLRLPSCTSFIVTDTHLIYTTSQHLVKFVHLHTGELRIPADEPEKDERCRSIERGAKIVTVAPSAYSLVLQMPRGNLETIYPRALVLAGIRDRITKRDYKKAFLICRTHRVDMSILHDYAPAQFMHDVGLFVKQVKKAEYIDLFLSSLSEENVSETIYKDTLPPTEAAVINGAADGMTNGDGNSSSPETPLKVNRICHAFLQILRDDASRLQNTVTAHVCKSPPDLEAGLRLVSELRKQGNQERLEQAVEHICFLADINQLYDAALGLYDLDVALLVAQESQKDPREYLPYLQELHDMQPLRQQFKIDDDLKRNKKALSHLYALEAFDELKAYMAKHELYAAAIDLFRYDTARLSELMQLYADFLSSRNRYKEAGIAYESISDYASAYGAYRAANMWRECLASAAIVPLNQDELLTLAQDFADGLEEAKDYAAAAAVNLDHLDDLENSARLLCKGYHFAEAMRQVTLRRRPELVAKIIDPGLVEVSATMTELLAEMKSQLAAQVPRLRELRQKKADDPMAFLDGADGGDGDVPDNISLAPTDASTSGGTFMTRYTNRSVGTLETNATRKTSRNRRREERKRARGKKGTVYEEEYLVNSIARLIERVNEIGEDLSRLVEGLMRRNMRERAVAVQAAMDDIIEAVKSCTDEVFGMVSEGDGVAHPPAPDGGEALPRPWGGQGVLWDALTSHRQQAPTLRSFPRLGLLP